MNTDDLVEFVSTLDPDENHVHYFSGIHPKPGGGIKERIQAFGTLGEMVGQLAQRNQEGYGIFICANDIAEDYTDGYARRKPAQVRRIRAVFADWDDAMKVPPENFPLPPSMVVNTSLGKYHFYWLVDDFPIEQFTQAQRGIAAALGTDVTSADLVREMRLPGFDHTKGAREPVRLLECHPERRYSVDEVMAAFPYRKVVKLNVPWDGQMRARSKMTAAIVEHMYGPPREDGAYNMPCPWTSEHTTPSTATSTIYYPPGPDNQGRGWFKCLHAHCAERYADHLDAWMSERVALALG